MKTDKWEEELRKITGGYCWAQDGGNGGYEWSDIKSFIRSLLAEQKKEIEDNMNFNFKVMMRADKNEKITRLIEEFNKWCQENKIAIGQYMKRESIMIADWWIRKFQKLEKKEKGGVKQK